MFQAWKLRIVWRTWVRYASKYYLCNENFISVISHRSGAEPPHHTVILSSVSHHFLKADLCYSYCLFRWRTQEPLAVASSPTLTPSLACGCSLKHWACRDCATRTLACPYRSLRTPEWPNRTLIHRVRPKTLCFDTLRNDIWEVPSLEGTEWTWLKVRA